MKLPSTAGEEPIAVPMFRKGLDLKHAVAGSLASDYHSRLVDDIKGAGFRYENGRLVVHLAQEFGFCYGVDRAVDYAYQTRARFPDQRVFLTGEIIHNPQVNAKLRAAGVLFLSDPDHAIPDVTSKDVVILPAFGVTVHELAELSDRGCTLVDTTCGSVLNVWKNVRQYTRDGFTAVIHGKIHHEETRATASQALASGAGRFLIVLDHPETELLCDAIRGQAPSEQFLEQLGSACSPGFDPEVDLRRIGLANQTTMLMSESLEIGELIRKAMAERYGEDALQDHYRAFETICSATQDRQDAIQALLGDRQFDLAVVIGGYNSSNTKNLARMCAHAAPTFHIAEPACLVSPSEIRHRPATGPTGDPSPGEVTSHGWLPRNGTVTVAVTAGASTPDSIVGDVISRLATFTHQ